MTNYDENLEKYKRMQKKTLDPEPTPWVVAVERLFGKPLIIVMGILAILLIVTIIGGGYQTLDENLTAGATAAFCLALVYIGFRMDQTSRFYRDSRRWLKKPGSIPVKQLAVNTRRTEADALKLTKNMIRKKYYMNLEISDDKKTILIHEIEPEEKK